MRLTELIELSDVPGSKPLLAAFLEEGLDIGPVGVEVPLGHRVPSDDDLSPRIRTIGDPVVTLLPVHQTDFESCEKNCASKLRIPAGGKNEVLEIYLNEANNSLKMMNVRLAMSS